MTDRYDRAIEYLAENPEEIRDAWANPHFHPAGCLFLYTSEDGRAGPVPWCGCLTQVAARKYGAQTPELAEAIRNDLTLPVNPQSVTLEDLGRFAGWQRTIDDMFPGRNPE